MFPHSFNKEMTVGAMTFRHYFAYDGRVRTHTYQVNGNVVSSDVFNARLAAALLPMRDEIRMALRLLPKD